MASSFRLPRCSPLFAAFFGIASAFAASPVLDDPLALENGSAKVTANIPVGKTLVLPLTASDADGDVLGFTVASSHPKIMARVRTGLTRLRLHVSYAGDPAATPASAAFSGDLDFVLFRDFTPVTAELFGGLSQGGYYDPRQEGTEIRSHLFHRVVKDFALQAGDPNGQLPDPALPADPLIRGPGYTFDNEFSGSLIFSGRGQLAMANGGSAQGRQFLASDARILLGDFMNCIPATYV